MRFSVGVFGETFIQESKFKQKLTNNTSKLRKMKILNGHNSKQK